MKSTSGESESRQECQQRNGSLLRTTLIRDIYRSLLARGRSYAAFTKDDVKLLALIEDQGEILDPMSGYGGLMGFCASLGIRSFGLEMNPPQYFWQLLRHPGNSHGFAEASDILLRSKAKWPSSSERAAASDECFCDEGKSLLFRLLEIIRVAVDKVFGSRSQSADLPVSLLLPFVGRLACTTPGDTSAHTKKGGICVLRGWEQDFRSYLTCLRSFLAEVTRTSQCNRHAVNFGDARTFRFPKDRFTGMLTSPPYPNHRDFGSIFLPENAFLEELSKSCEISWRGDPNTLVGSNFVKSKSDCQPDSAAATKFLAAAASAKRNRRACYDDDVYYFPYFRQYFSDLERAYINVAPGLRRGATGFIIVVNNTHRGIVVPVAEVVMDIWRSLGFTTEIIQALEGAHLGAKNPRAKGMRALHTEYVVRIHR